MKNLICTLAIALIACGPAGPDKIGAYVACTSMVKRQLVSPSSAEFPYYTDPGVVVAHYSMGDESVANDRYDVVGHFDSQNRFGAMLRGRFVCTGMTRNEARRSWAAEDVKLTQDE